MTTIRERVLEWIIDHGPGEFTVNTVAAELGLERRQTLNALHGLHLGLKDQLVRGSSGMWLWTPVSVIRLQSEYGDFKYDGGDKPAMFLPVGWRGELEVIARLGDVYLARGVITDKYFLVRMIHGPVELLDTNSE